MLVTSVCPSVRYQLCCIQSPTSVFVSNQGAFTVKSLTQWSITFNLGLGTLSYSVIGYLDL